MTTVKEISGLDVRAWQGQALVYLNGEPFFWWEAGAVGIDLPSGDDFDRQKANDSAYERAEILGCNVIELVGITPRAMPGPDEGFDDLVARIDRSLEKILARGAYAFMRIELDNKVPDWYPGTVFERQDGQLATYQPDECKASLHDPVFLDYGCGFIRRIVQHYKDHPYVLGYTPVFGCCNQCSYPNFGWFDFSPAALKEWRDWVTTHHEDVEALNAAWGTDYSDFEKLDFDVLRTKDISESGEALVRDFKQFRRESLHRVYRALIEEITLNKGANQLTGAFCELVAGGPGHRRGEDPAGYADTSAQVFKSAAGYFNPMQWDWPGVPDDKWLGAIDNAPNWICATPYLKERLHLAELSFGHCASRPFPERCAGTTATIFDTLREPAAFSFFVLPNYTADIVERLTPQIEYLKQFQSLYWGRDVKVGILMDVERHLTGGRADYLAANEHYLRASRALFRLGVAHDLVYDDFVEDRLAANEYPLLFTPPGWINRLASLETTTRVVEIDAPESVDLTSHLQEAGVVWARHAGLESVRLNDRAWVGRAGVADAGPVFVPLSAPGTIHARRVRGHDLFFHDVPTERGQSENGDEGLWIKEPFAEHDLQFVFVTR